MLNNLKRTESIVAFVLLLIAAAVLVAVFVFNNGESVVEGSNPETPAAETGSDSEQPAEPGTPTTDEVNEA